MNAVKKLNTFQQRVLRRMHKIIPDRPAAIAMFWKPQRGKRKQGRPKTTWKRTFEKDLKTLNLTLEDSKEVALERHRWKSLVARCASWRWRN